ncbi:hypothetical protein HS99_0019395 [Kitasatospora aureofaciens]|uniref:Uncharacterized protein n=1 Tax=Kitasatospora aureofaciens TaxID=1894 RepID=A0A1E7NDT9_KITAU|nr:hypothetical protein HS99_0019395 [Kitasatospora aureofaciens]
MLEGGLGVPVGAREGDPELGAMQVAGVRAGDSSEWEIARPEVIRPSSYGRTVCRLPRLSRCSTSPWWSQLTV